MICKKNWYGISAVAGKVLNDIDMLTGMVGRSD